jgi:hypothetical protein
MTRLNAWALLQRAVKGNTLEEKPVVALHNQPPRDWFETPSKRPLERWQPGPNLALFRMLKAHMLI